VSIGYRIKTVRDSVNLTQAEFASRISLTASSIAKQESGVNNPSEQTLKMICREFNVSYGWLKYGYEPMMEPQESLDMGLLENIMYGDNEYVKAVFRELASMPKEWWQLSLQMLDRIAESKKQGR
jgi:transcriptional regulator with XRE-family HTH domain